MYLWLFFYIFQHIPWPNKKRIDIYSVSPIPSLAKLAHHARSRRAAHGPASHGPSRLQHGIEDGVAPDAFWTLAWPDRLMPVRRPNIDTAAPKYTRCAAWTSSALSVVSCSQRAENGPLLKPRTSWITSPTTQRYQQFLNCSYLLDLLDPVWMLHHPLIFSLMPCVSASCVSASVLRLIFTFILLIPPPPTEGFWWIGVFSSLESHNWVTILCSVDIFCNGRSVVHPIG